MFRRRNKSSLKDAVDRASDPGRREIEAEIAELQEEIARLELELFDTEVELARFTRELERRTGPLEQRIDELNEQIKVARHEASRKAQWGDKLNASDAPVDVEAQFEKAWKKPPVDEAPEPEPKSKQVDRDALKKLYRELAKRFHPDLVTEPAEKTWREDVMAKVNEAYATGDYDALVELSRSPDYEPVVAKTPSSDPVDDLQKQVEYLRGMESKLRYRLQQLVNSDMVRLMLDATIARRAGRDLIGAMASELRLEIARLEAELVSYQA